MGFTAGSLTPPKPTQPDPDHEPQPEHEPEPEPEPESEPPAQRAIWAAAQAKKRREKAQEHEKLLARAEARALMTDAEREAEQRLHSSPRAAVEKKAAAAHKAKADPHHMRVAGAAVQAAMRLRDDGACAAVPPACEDRFEYCVGFVKGEEGRRIAAKLLKILTEHLLCVEHVVSKQEESSLLVTTSAAQFDSHAESDEIRKWTKAKDHISGEPRPELFSKANAEKFAGSYLKNKYGKGELGDEYPSRDFYKPAERLRMIHAMMDSIPAAREECAALVEEVAELDGFGQIRSPVLEQESLIDALARAGMVVAVCPLHDGISRQSLWNCTKVVVPLSAPVDAVRNYYGEAVAMYFAWLDWLMAALIVPSVLGLYVWGRRSDSASIDTDTNATFFALFIVLWGFAAVQHWKRTANGHAWRWDSECSDGWLWLVTVAHSDGDGCCKQRWRLSTPLI